MKHLALAMLTMALTACASTEQARLGDAAATPLTDLNIAKTAIPAALQNARATPYSAPADQTCFALAEQVATLDALLGPDIDAPVIKLGTAEAGRAMVGKAATGAIQNAVEGAIPFRGWLRKLSGAERHSKDVEAAVLAGNIRRGFLKGVMHKQACSDPATPATPAA